MSNLINFLIVVAVFYGWYRFLGKEAFIKLWDFSTWWVSVPCYLYALYGVDKLLNLLFP